MILASNAVEEDAVPNRWNFKKAEWLSFQAQCSSEPTEEVVISAEDPTGQFTDLLIPAAGKAIPKARLSRRLPRVPRFNGSCKKAVQESSVEDFCSNPMLSTLVGVLCPANQCGYMSNVLKENNF